MFKFLFKKNRIKENHIKAEVIDLTIDDILKITPKDILYAEVAETGAERRELTKICYPNFFLLTIS